MEENRQKILCAANELFMRYGIRSVSMDDIARHLGISKKTIYQSFNEKEQIVFEVNRMHQDMWDKEMSMISQSSSNAIEEMLMFSVVFREQIKKMNPSLMFDLFKYHRESWEDWSKYKTTVIKQKVIDTINRGKKEGNFRQNLNADILSVLRVEQIEMAFNDTLFPHNRFNFEEVQMQIFDHFVYGLLTEKGRQLYEKRKNKILENKTL